MLLRAAKSQLLFVDVQKRLLPAMHGGDAALDNCVRLARAANHFAVPITLSEQYPKGIGPTVAQLSDAVASGGTVLEKMSFSCAGDDGLAAHIGKLQARGCRQLIIAGIESHVCVLQTALDFSAEERTGAFEVFVVADAVASRKPESRTLALERMRTGGVHVVTTEMVIFEWLGQAGTADFKAMMPLIK